MQYEEKKEAVQKKLKLTDRELDRLVASDKNCSKIEYLHSRLNSLPHKNWNCTQSFWHTPQEYFDICCEVSELIQVKIQNTEYDAAFHYCPHIPSVVEEYQTC